MTLLAKPKTGVHIFLFDGVCGLCNKFVQFVLPKDSTGKFQFASLQSDFAVSLLKEYKITASDLSTVYVIADYGQTNQRLLSKSDAASFVFSQLDGIWSLLAAIKYVPKPLRNWGYDLVASNRYKIFGKKDSCLLPDGSAKDRFIQI